VLLLLLLFVLQVVNKAIAAELIFVATTNFDQVRRHRAGCGVGCALFLLFCVREGRDVAGSMCSRKQLRFSSDVLRLCSVTSP
jgi:hypothetical protein